MPSNRVPSDRVPLKGGDSGLTHGDRVRDSLGLTGTRDSLGRRDERETTIGAPPRDYTYDPWRALALAVLHKAQVDFKDKDKRAEVREFAWGWWFDVLCMLVDIAPEKMRRAILKGPQGSRRRPTKKRRP